VFGRQLDTPRDRQADSRSRGSKAYSRDFRRNTRSQGWYNLDGSTLSEEEYVISRVTAGQGVGVGALATLGRFALQENWIGTLDQFAYNQRAARDERS
jgi:hypothetical protein